MVVTNYQIHNVIGDYSKRLSRNRQAKREKADTASPDSDRINLSIEGKRKAVVDRVAANIVERITRFGPQNDVDREIVGRLRDEVDKNGDYKNQNAVEFVFNVIDGNQTKTTNTLSAKDSGAMLKRLEELTREKVDRDMASTQMAEAPSDDAKTLN